MRFYSIAASALAIQAIKFEKIGTAPAQNSFVGLSDTSESDFELPPVAAKDIKKVQNAIENYKGPGVMDKNDI